MGACATCFDGVLSRANGSHNHDQRLTRLERSIDILNIAATRNCNYAAAEHRYEFDSLLSLQILLSDNAATPLYISNLDLSAVQHIGLFVALHGSHRSATQKTRSINFLCCEEQTFARSTRDFKGLQYYVS